MAKAGIHPEGYTKIEVVHPNGESFFTRSTLNKEVLKLDVSPVTHPAWVGGRIVASDKDNRAAGFKKKFAGLNFMDSDS